MKEYIEPKIKVKEIDNENLMDNSINSGSPTSGIDNSPTTGGDTSGKTSDAKSSIWSSFDE